MKTGEEQKGDLSFYIKLIIRLQKAWEKYTPLKIVIRITDRTEGPI
jgi:hypothetical protein